MKPSTRPRQPKAGWQGSLFDVELHSEVERLRGLQEHARATSEDLRVELDALQQRLASVERTNATLRQDRTALITRCNTLEAENAALTTLLRLGSRPTPAATPQHDFVRALTQLAARVHPDRHGGAALATELTQAVLAVRDTVAGKSRTAKA